MVYKKYIFAFIAIIFLNTLLFRSHIVDFFDYKIFDIFTNISVQKATNTNNSNVVIVNIDEKSLELFGQWPWPRILLANLIQKISSSNPASIGMDIIFSEKDNSSPIVIKHFYDKFFSINMGFKNLPKNFFDNDKILSQVISNANMTLPVYLDNRYKHKMKCQIKLNNFIIDDISNSIYKADSLLCNLPILQKAAKNTGFINASFDKDGIFRRVALFARYKDYIIPSIALSVIANSCSIYLQKNILKVLDRTTHLGKKEEILLKFYHPSWYKVISASDILLNKIDKNLLKGKFVLIGASAIGLHDRYITPLNHTMPGINIIATIIDNIIKGESIYIPMNAKKLNNILSTIFLFIFIFLIFNKRYLELTTIFLLVLSIYFIVSYILYIKGVFIEPAYFLIPYMFGFFILNIITMFISYVERKRFDNEISDAHSLTIDSLSLVVESRDNETGAHILRTKEYVKLIGNYMLKNNIYKDKLNKELIELAYKASPLHDIGKVAIPDKVLKKEGKLSKEEYEIMKTHASIGGNIIKNILKQNSGNKFLQVAKNIAHYHHEKWDGTGYPDGLSKEDIPIEARIMAIADVYDALTSKRVYKKSFDFEVSEEIIINGRGTHFDPVMVDVFITLKNDFKEIALKIKE